MKTKISKIESALKRLHKVIEEEVKEKGSRCNTMNHNGYICTRGKYHSGNHIATGSEKVYEMWSQ